MYHVLINIDGMHGFMCAKWVICLPLDKSEAQKYTYASGIVFLFFKGLDDNNDNNNNNNR